MRHRYYAECLAEAQSGASLLLADRSPEAVRALLRAVPAATGVVLDIWRPLPLRDAVADVVLALFAPGIQQNSLASCVPTVG